MEISRAPEPLAHPDSAPVHKIGKRLSRISQVDAGGVHYALVIYVAQNDDEGIVCDLVLFRGLTEFGPFCGAVVGNLPCYVRRGCAPVNVDHRIVFVDSDYVPLPLGLFGCRLHGRLVGRGLSSACRRAVEHRCCKSKGK